ALKLDSLRIAVYDRAETPDPDPFARHGYALRYYYDRAGHRLSRTDAVPSFANNQQTYQYDPGSGLLTATTDYTATATFGYDAAGRLRQWAVGSSFSEARDYDDDDALIARSNPIYADTLVYDARGKVLE